ncbi:MAG: TonB-dependent receptor [Paludibacter sp.]|nr:TonB-dependent receptor [Paludibacter sp.]
MKKARPIAKAILLSLFLTVFTLNTSAQKVTLSFQNETFEKVLNSIKQQTGLSLVFSEQLVDLNRKISIDVNSIQLEDALKQLLLGTNLGYEIKNNKLYFVEKKSDKLKKASAKLKKISGLVTDEKGEPIIGASIVLKGSNTGTITNIDGTFSLDVQDQSEITISYIGYKQSSLKIGKYNNYTIILEEDSKALDEVVVVGYGVQKKRDLTGAVGSVKMIDVPVSTVSTISHALAGTVAGLQVNTLSAQPGGATTFNIRGATSTTGNDPLIVIDGFPISQDGEPGSGNRYDGGSKDFILSSINPNDIESIEVLKDASATAIYGSRAGHGVILITTKRGKTGAPTVKYSVNTAFQTLSDTYKMLSAKDFMIENNKYAYESYLITNKIAPYGVRQLSEFPSDWYTPVYNQTQIDNPLVNTDWVGAITQSGRQQQHNLSVNGGTETTQYQASLGYFDQTGVVKNNGMKRYSSRVNLDQVLSKYFKTGISLLINHNNFDNVPLGSGANEFAGIIRSATQFTPLMPIKDANGDYSLSQVRPFVPNPVSLLNITDKSVDERALGVYYLDFTPIKDLKLKLNTGFDRKYRKRSTYIPVTTLYGKNANGEASINQYDNIDFLLETTATYNKQFLTNNKINAMLGYSYQTFSKEGLNLGNSNFITDAFLYNNIGAGQFAKPTVGSWSGLNSMASFFGRINYSLLERYLITATMRADGASNLASGHQWGYFPSVAAGWRFSDEPFMAKFKNVLTNGKLRVSYGETGNSNIGNGAMSYYVPSSNVVLGETEYGGVQLGQVGNSLLKWETMKETNLGLEIGLFNRLNVTAEVYHRENSNLLNALQLMSYYPISSVAGNVGTTQSTGFELTINSQNISTKNFKWNTILTLSTYKDTWKTRPDSWKPASYEGVNDPIRAIYSYTTGGLIQPDESVPYMLGAQPGMIKMLDINGFQRDTNGDIVYDTKGMPLKTGTPDGKLDDADMKLIGSYDPSFVFGLSNNFKYKNFDLSIYLYGVFDKLMPATYIDNGIWGATMITQDQNAPDAIKTMWRSDNLTSKVPGYTQMYNQYGAGDFFLTKMWFVRVRNVSLGYNFMFKKVISNLRVYADVNNPCVFTNYKGLDPETDNSDVAYPNVRTFSLGIDVTF